MQRVTLTH